jgi:hypothetical protein
VVLLSFGFVVSVGDRAERIDEVLEEGGNQSGVNAWSIDELGEDSRSEELICICMLFLAVTRSSVSFKL